MRESKTKQNPQVLYVQLRGKVMEVVLDGERRRVGHANGKAAKLRLKHHLKVAEWVLMLVKYNGCCAYCGRPFSSIDHIVPLSNGGGTFLENVVPCCGDCNTRKGSAVWLPERCGWTVGDSQ